MANDKRPRKRTTDERIEAIAMNLELLSHQMQDLDRLVKDSTAQTTRNFEMALDSIKRLENIARAHEHRLDDDEGPAGGGK